MIALILTLFKFKKDQDKRLSKIESRINTYFMTHDFGNNEDWAEGGWE